jgi:hypothetical protein
LKKVGSEIGIAGRELKNSLLKITDEDFVKFIEKVVDLNQKSWTGENYKISSNQMY